MAQASQSIQLTPQSFLQDPLLSASIKSCHMTLSVKSSALKTISGYFHSVDPHGGVFVLLILDQSKTKIEDTRLVWQHAITAIAVDKSNVMPVNLVKQFEEYISPKDGSDLSPEETIIRRNKILDSLKDANLPYEVDETTGQINVASTAQIDPPYGLLNITCDNLLVLQRVRELISQSNCEESK